MWRRKGFEVTERTEPEVVYSLPPSFVCMFFAKLRCLPEKVVQASYLFNR